MGLAKYEEAHKKLVTESALQLFLLLILKHIYTSVSASLTILADRFMPIWYVKSYHLQIRQVQTQGGKSRKQWPMEETQTGVHCTENRRLSKGARWEKKTWQLQIRVSLHVRREQYTVKNNLDSDMIWKSTEMVKGKTETKGYQRVEFYSKES